MNLTRKMMLQMTVLILIPVLAIGIGCYSLASKALEVSAQEEAKQMAKLHSEKIIEKLESMQSLIQVASTNQGLENLIKGSEQSNPKEIITYLNRIQKNNEGSIEMMVLVNRQGDALLSDTKDQLHINVSDRAYFKKTIESGKGVISDVILNKETNSASVVVTEPIKSNGKVTGMLLGTISFDVIKEIVADIEIGSQGYGYLINKDGLLLSHPDPDKENVYSLYEDGNQELNAILDLMTDRKYGDGYYTFDGEYKYVAYAPVNTWSIASTANYDDYMASAIRIKRLSLIIALSALVLALVSAYMFTRFGLIKPIKKLVEAMLKAGKGDLTARTQIKTKDEIRLLGDTFNEMMDMQSDIISQIRGASSVLMDTAEELAASAQETTATTEEITAKIDEIANDSYKQTEVVADANAAFVDLRDSVGNTSQMADESEKESQKSLEVAKKGRSLIKETVVSIHNISGSTDDTVSVLNQLDVTAQEVSGISATINGIADSINLLALNASIEAARAGEHGRGFTVVAEEVRKLAEQTSNESKEIQSLLSDILKQVANATSAIGETKHSVDQGVSTVSQVDGMFTEIIGLVEKIDMRIKTVGKSAHKELEISADMKEVVGNVDHMARTIAANTQEIAAGAEEQAAISETMSASAEETSSMAESLNEMVSHFKVLDKPRKYNASTSKPEDWGFDGVVEGSSQEKSM